jgi:D-amino-acid oxidase
MDHCAESEIQYSVTTSDDAHVFYSDFLRENFTHCFHYTVPAIDMSLYMKYLEHLFHEKGGIGIIQKYIHSIDKIYQLEREQFTTGFDLVVNCSSLGSHHLFNDRNMCAYQGHTLHIQLPIQNGNTNNNDPLNKMFYLALSNSATKEDTYVIPRTNGVYVLGGTAQFIPNERLLDTVKPEEIDWNVSNDILQRCSQIVPCPHLLSVYRVVRHWVGWRPYRKNGMRIELAQEETCNGGRTVLHCYGFGGCGVTLSWGAAHEVCKLARQVLLPPQI